jgi:[protein-PII] uridylyltransferase
VRCHLHYLTGRAEERLTFDLQPEIARRMGYRDRQQGRAVERFMKRYYLAARDVGALTRIVCAALEDKHQRRPRLACRASASAGGGSTASRSRATGSGSTTRPCSSASRRRCWSCSTSPRSATSTSARRRSPPSPRRCGRVGSRRLRDDPDSSRLFLDVLCSRKDPATTLSRMSEAGLLGRLMPDFGRVVGQTQHNLYHVYTVDEHTIRAVDTLHRIERGELAGELPLASEILPKILSRRELYLAIFLHDLGKGRGGDHSVAGEAIAQRLCRRLGLPDDATETVAWLVRHHLVMSNVAFRRDIEDPQTIATSSRSCSRRSG